MSQIYTEQDLVNAANTAINNYKENGGDSLATRALDGVTETANNIAKETAFNAKMESGRRLYDNIHVIITEQLLGRLSWFQKLLMRQKQQDLIVLGGVYLVIHAIKSGGFGLTNYRVNHSIIDMLSSECNARIMSTVLGGFDTNIAKSLFTAPTITEVGE